MIASAISVANILCGSVDRCWEHPEDSIRRWNLRTYGSRIRFGESIFTNPSSPDFGNPGATFPTIYDQLQLHGYTNKGLFSIWLHDQSAKKGSILFGGADNTKYRGQLQSLHVILQDNIFRTWAVNLTSVVYIDSSSGETQALTADDFEITTILDSGSPNMYLSPPLVELLTSRMGAILHQGTPYVSCDLRQSHESLEFGLGRKRHGPRITVPYSEIIYPYGFPANMGNVNDDDDSPLCYLGLIGTNGPTFLLGDTFIRSAYVVYDVDHLQILRAPVKHDRGREIL
jgi:hypothetical protein